MKQSKVLIAVTGGIGSGKSSALAAIADMGYPVFSADRISRSLYRYMDFLLATGGASRRRTETADRYAEVLPAMLARFPECFSGGKRDRKKLAQIVFSDAEALADLNAIMHPAIMHRLFELMRRAGGRFLFAEIPLLFEGGYEKYFDEVIVILRREESRIAATVARDGCSAEEAMARMKNQFDYEKNLPSGQTVIYTDGDLSSLNRQVTDAVAALVQKYSD